MHRYLRSLVLLASALMSLQPLVAVEFRSGDTTAITAGETIADDVIATGGTVETRGTITGDLLVAAGNATISGPVRGNLIVAAGNVTVLAPVGGSIYLAGGNITISAPVTRNVVMTGGTLMISPEATVGRDLAISGGNVTLAGSVTRDVKASVGMLRLAGTARVGRDLVVMGTQPTVEAGAVIGGQTLVTEPQARRKGMAIAWIWGAIFRLLLTIGLFLLSIAFLMVAPRMAGESVRMLLVHPWASLLAGLVLFIVVPIAAFVLLFILLIIGLPLGMVLLFLYGIALFLAPVVVALWLGSLILRRAGAIAYGPLLLGLFLLFLLRLVPVLGMLVGLVVTLLGLGALFLAWQGRSANPIYPAASSQVTDEPPQAS